ncbi:MAG TPA: hypothetical protein ENJ56_00980 [Anaerolineae bacterium]|nr:hypothetical protein [Anaerolineae bacterium]
MNTSILTGHLKAWSATASSAKRYFVLGFTLLLLLAVTGCAVGAAPPAVVCDSLNSGIYTIRLVGGVFILLTLVIVAVTMLGSKVLKSSVAIGGVVVMLVAGVVLLAAAPAIATTFITMGGGTMPDVVALCGIS